VILVDEGPRVVGPVGVMGLVVLAGLLDGSGGPEVGPVDPVLVPGVGRAVLIGVNEGPTGLDVVLITDDAGAEIAMVEAPGVGLLVDGPLVEGSGGPGVGPIEVAEAKVGALVVLGGPTAVVLAVVGGLDVVGPLVEGRGGPGVDPAEVLAAGVGLLVVAVEGPAVLAAPGVVGLLVVLAVLALLGAGGPAVWPLVEAAGGVAGVVLDVLGAAVGGPGVWEAGPAELVGARVGGPGVVAIASAARRERELMGNKCWSYVSLRVTVFYLIPGRA
jgi:hypothetical protein